MDYVGLPDCCPAYTYEFQTRLGYTCWADMYYAGVGASGKTTCPAQVELEDTLGLCDDCRKLIIGK